MPDPSPPLRDTPSLPEISGSGAAIPIASEVYFFHAPRPHHHRYWLHLLLLLLTFFTTLIVGSRLEFNFIHGFPPFSTDADFFPITWALAVPRRLLMGIPFSFTLMFILLAHEMGHYVYCVRYGVVATLPFFIPAPTPIGTLGAFIRIKSPMGSRRALFDIGIAGPIAGFIVATAALAVSLTLSRPAPIAPLQGFLPHDFPLVFVWMNRFLRHEAGGFVPLQGMLLHPIAIAAWVGMFATALNLLPGGQLDGGHILYSISPALHRWVSRLTVLALIPLGLFMWTGWLLWAALLALSGMRHPQIGPGYRSLLGYGTNGTNAPHQEGWRGLGRGRVVLALAALAMLILTFMPTPIEGAGLLGDRVPRRWQQHIHFTRRASWNTAAIAAPKN